MTVVIAMTDYALEIDGRVYRPVRRSWVDHGVDAMPNVEQRLYAVSVARVDDVSISVRYADREENVVTVRQDMVQRRAEGEYQPRALLSEIDEWPRSLVASRRESDGVLRAPEREHFATLWGERFEPERRAVADGGDRI